MNVGLHKEKYERTNALSSAAAVGGRLRRMVRPEGYASLQDATHELKCFEAVVALKDLVHLLLRQGS